MTRLNGILTPSGFAIYLFFNSNVKHAAAK